MLEFREIDISDRDRINNCLAKSDFMGCEYSFANNFAWRRLGDSQIAFFKDFYICGAFKGGNPRFVLPAGSGDIREVITELKRFSENKGYPLVINGVTAPSLEILRDIYGDAFTSESDRDYSDYIYLRCDLADLAGRKYHKKRTHLARFKELDYEYSAITEKDFDECIVFCTQNYNDRVSQDSSMIAEQFALNAYFSFYNELRLNGGIIRIDGKISALSIGEKLNSSTFAVHIEKADRSFNGIYVAINNHFVLDNTDGYKYINREEDLGIEGLRKSKLSYHPAFILEKYSVIFK